MTFSIKKYAGLLAIVASFMVLISCDDSVSYADRLKNERKLIKNLINELDLEVVNGFPADSIFEEGVYYKDNKTGVYLSVVSYGNKDKMAETYSDVTFRINKARMLSSDSTSISYNGSQFYASFIYGIQSTYKYSQYGSYANYLMAYYFLSPAVAIPLQYVGEGGIVNMIVPFNSGSYYQYDDQSYDTILIEGLRYTIIN